MKSIVHELDPKKKVFGSDWSTKHNIDCWSPQGVYFLEKCDELSESVALGQKLRYFADQNGPAVGPDEIWICSHAPFLSYGS